jgi:hypothetical protein
VAKRLSPTFLTLVHEAALKSYWRRQALRRFLRQAGIAEPFLSTWTQEESKRDFLDRLFAKLPEQSRGQEMLLQMAKDLSAQDTFPDLAGWEDSKQKIRDATIAVAASTGFQLARRSSSAKSRSGSSPCTAQTDAR